MYRQSNRQNYTFDYTTLTHSSFSPLNYALPVSRPKSAKADLKKNTLNTLLSNKCTTI